MDDHCKPMNSQCRPNFLTWCIVMLGHKIHFYKCHIQGVPEKIAQSLSTTSFQSRTTELSRFQQNVQKQRVYTTKVIVWIRRLIFFVIQLASELQCIWKQSSRLGDTTFSFKRLFLSVRRRLHGKKSFHPRIKLAYLALSHTFLRTLVCIQSFQFVCCCQELNFTASKHFELLSYKSFLAILTKKNMKFQSLSWSPMDSYLMVVLLGWELVTNQLNVRVSSHWTTTTTTRRPFNTTGRINSS